MTSSEKRKLKNLPTPHNMFWVPTMWFSTLVNQCMEEGRIRDEIHLKTLLDEVTGFKASLGMLYSYDWISIPLVYTQVTTIAVYGFFFACLMGRQYIESSAENPTLGETDLYVPLFTLMQFFFYMGWLKVAEVLINPFGEDEDDFETNWMIDRNYQVAMLGVDELYGDMPELEKDMYWDDLEPELPYTKSTICHKNEPFMGSTADFSLDPEDIGSQMVNPMETIPEVGRAPTPGEANTPHSPVSSPTKLRRFLANITSAFSQESITDSKPAGLHIKDPLFSHSPLLQRVKSSSVKRSLSHTDHLGPHRRIGSLSNVDVSCGSMGQPIITHVSVVAPNGHSWKHSNRPGPTHVSLLKDNSQRSLSSKASLAVNVRDAPLKTSDITSPYLSATGPCNPSGVFYKKPDPFELLGNNNAAGSAQQLQYNTDHTHDNDRRQGLQKDNGAALNTFYTNSSLEHSQPAEHPLPPNGNTVDRCDAQSSYTNPIATLCFSDNRSTAFVGEVHPTAVLGTSEAVSSDQNACNVFTPVAPSTAVCSNPNPAAFYSDYHAETPVRQDVAQCNSVWSNNGATPASLNASASHITSTSTLQPSSSAQPVPDQAYHPGTSTPVQTGPTNNHSLLERKADSEDSIDSTYDSSYDTINSQEPLLEASSHWEKHV